MNIAVLVMTRRAFLKSLGASLTIVVIPKVRALDPNGFLGPPYIPQRSLDLANGIAFVYAANVVLPHHRAYYLSKARLCLLLYKQKYKEKAGLI